MLINIVIHKKESGKIKKYVEGGQLRSMLNGGAGKSWQVLIFLWRDMWKSPKSMSRRFERAFCIQNITQSQVWWRKILAKAEAAEYISASGQIWRLRRSSRLCRSRIICSLATAAVALFTRHESRAPPYKSWMWIVTARTGLCPSSFGAEETDTRSSFGTHVGCCSME